MRPWHRPSAAVLYGQRLPVCRGAPSTFSTTESYTRRRCPAATAPASHDQAKKLADWLESHAEQKQTLQQPGAEILVPIERPNKLFLLAGNYAKHIEEGGGVAVERAETFPYVFMKPPTTTLTAPGRPIFVPSVSPNAIDWELEVEPIVSQKDLAQPTIEFVKNNF